MKIKVGLLNDSFPPVIDGVANTVKAYADILSRTDEPVVITPKYPHVKDEYPYEVYRYLSIPTDRLIGYRSGDPFEPVALTELANRKLDIMHVHCPFASAVLAINIKRLMRNRLPLVFTYHTKFDIDIKKRVPFKQLHKPILRFVVNNIAHMDEVWVVSEGAGENLRSLGYKGSYRVMPNGTDFKRGRADEDKVAALRQKLGIAGDEIVFLFVGRMMWYKNTGLIVDAMKILADKGAKCKALFVGSGEDKHAIEEYVAQLKLNDRVIFTGPVYDREELRVYYSLADMFTFPSTYDTSGLVVREAAACDCPSLLVKGSCASEGVEDRVSGYLCEESAESCAEAMLEAINDREKLKEIGKTAGEKVYYSWESAVADARRAYEEIIVARTEHRHFIHKQPKKPKKPKKPVDGE